MTRGAGPSARRASGLVGRCRRDSAGPRRPPRCSRCRRRLRCAPCWTSSWARPGTVSASPAVVGRGGGGGAAAAPEVTAVPGGPGGVRRDWQARGPLFAPPAGRGCRDRQRRGGGSRAPPPPRSWRRRVLSGWPRWRCCCYWRSAPGGVRGAQPFRPVTVQGHACKILIIEGRT